MKKLFLIMFFMTQICCEKIELSEDIPQCIQSLIKKAIKQEDCLDVYSMINEYLFQGKIV
jgi:hypothetical protein